MKKNTPEAVSPDGPLLEAVEIIRDDSRPESPSLQLKLQEEMAKPLNGALRKAAADTSRVSRLKAVSYHS
jgi:hypothetical protein